MEFWAEGGDGRDDWDDSREESHDLLSLCVFPSSSLFSLCRGDVTLNVVDRSFADECIQYGKFGCSVHPYIDGACKGVRDSGRSMDLCSGRCGNEG